MSRRRRRLDLIDRHELIKDAVIEHDAHTLAGSAIGDGDEPLAGRVDLAQFGMTAVEPFRETRAIRREIDPAMNHQIESRKEIDQPRAALGMAAHQLVEQQQQPAWSPRYAADVRTGARSASRAIFSVQSVRRATSGGGYANRRTQPGTVAAAMPLRSPLRTPGACGVSSVLPPTSRLRPPKTRLRDDCRGDEPEGQARRAGSNAAYRG